MRDFSKEANFHKVCLQDSFRYSSLQGGKRYNVILKQTNLEVIKTDDKVNIAMEGKKGSSLLKKLRLQAKTPLQAFLFISRGFHYALNAVLNEMQSLSKASSVKMDQTQLGVMQQSHATYQFSELFQSNVLAAQIFDSFNPLCRCVAPTNKTMHTP